VPLPPIPVVGDDDRRAVLATCGSSAFVDLRDAAILQHRAPLRTGFR
jgi:hypothetical protein